MTGIGGHHSPVAGTDTWLTPPEIVQALGPFDLDPCAAPSPRPWDTATRHITWPEDGLTAPWAGRVWCNPPYGRATARWLARMADHGNGTALIFARTETSMFVDHVWRRATALLFIHGRLHFHYVDGARASANAGGPSVLVAYSERDAAALYSSGIKGHYVNGFWEVGS